MFTIPPSYLQEWTKPQWLEDTRENSWDLYNTHWEEERRSCIQVISQVTGNAAQTELSLVTSRLHRFTKLPLHERDRGGKRMSQLVIEKAGWSAL